MFSLCYLSVHTTWWLGFCWVTKMEATTSFSTKPIGTDHPVHSFYWLHKSALSRMEGNTRVWISGAKDHWGSFWSLDTMLLWPIEQSYKFGSFQQNLTSYQGFSTAVASYFTPLPLVGGPPWNTKQLNSRMLSLSLPRSLVLLLSLYLFVSFGLCSHSTNISWGLLCAIFRSKQNRISSYGAHIPLGEAD